MRSPVEQYQYESNIRQNMWDIIVKEKMFTRYSFYYIEGHRTTKATYLKSLEKAGLVENTGNFSKRGDPIFKLLATKHKKAPSINKDGVAVFEGALNQKMWQIMKIQGVFTARELAEISGAGLKTAEAYLRHLSNANYLTKFKENGKNKFKFNKIRNTGYYAPMIKKTKELYDPNLCKVISVEEVQYAVD